MRWKTGITPNPAELIRAVENAGYEAKINTNEGHDQVEHKVASWQMNLWIGIAGMVFLMAGEWIFQLGTTPWFRWFSFGLATLVQIFAGGPFYRAAWNQLKRRRANMDTLVALGSSISFVFSAWMLLAGSDGHLYFMEAAAIISLISIGHWVESRVGTRASAALQRLLNLAPAEARRRTHVLPAPGRSS